MSSAPPPGPCLPQHVLEAIIGQIPLLRTNNRGHPGYSQPAADLAPLVPLLGVCRLWRHVACSIFYRAARLGPGDESKTGLSRCWPMRLEDMVDNGRWTYVRSLLLTFSLSDLFLQHSKDISAIEATLQRCGPLYAVHSVHIVFGLGGFLAGGEVRRVDHAAGNMAGLVRRLGAGAPRLRRLGVQSDSPMYMPEVAGWTAQEIAHMLGDLVQTQFASLELPCVMKSSRLACSPAIASLQRLTLHRLSGSPDSVCLVRHCAKFLEQLQIEKAEASDTAQLIQGDSTGATLVYPRLRYLSISVTQGSLPASGQPSPVDPFPQLETLICSGQFPFPGLAFLAGGRSHLRHLEIVVDKGILERLEYEQVFSKDAFTQLCYISLGWMVHGVVGQYNGHALFRRALELSSHLQTVCLPDYWQDFPKLVIDDLRIPHTLRSLDIPYAELIVDDACEIFFSCPLLLKARISLQDIRVDCPEDSATLPERISEYQERYCGKSAALRCIALCMAGYTDQLLKAESIVLLADILQHVSRVCITNSWAAKSLEMQSRISAAQQRAEYRGHKHTEDLQVLVGDCW
ncbi:hypothetical protein GGF46_002332 [Coemansia sp. RSA 552]|nr:hypothetical protein GGF46_002332 [Coemansia sp. RSA 552]